MREFLDKKGKTIITKTEFDSLNDYMVHINKWPLNQPFQRAYDREGITDKTSIFYPIHSERQSPRTTSFTGTESFEEAMELFKNGVPDESKKLIQMLKAEQKMEPLMVQRRVNSIQGFQPIVPLYLAGVPNNMVSTRLKPVKQKVVNLYTNVSYLAHTKQGDIRKECIKKFRLITKLESQNYRVNLFLLFGVRSNAWSSNGEEHLCIIKLKSANERLNISKLSFPLVHPSMERRLLFKFVEKYPNLTDDRFLGGYGSNIPNDKIRAMIGNGVLLPLFIKKDIDEIRDLDDLKYL